MKIRELIDKISDEYLNNKANIKQRIRKFDEYCECNIKGAQSRISYVGPR